MNHFPHSTYRLAIFVAALTISAFALRAGAQQLDCSDQVKVALQTTGTKCDQIARNSACYGNTLVVATPNDSVQAQDFVFQAPGDTVKVADLRSLRLAPLDQTNNQWGIAYLRIQANLPDTAAGQYVTMLMFGDTQLQDVSQTVSTAANPVKPMQAVYFRTGIGSPACHTAPTSGLIIQAPQGLQQPVKMTVDGVELGISSTVFIQAEADDLDTQLPVRVPNATATGTVSPTFTPTNTPPPTNTPRAASHTTPVPRILKIATIEGRVTVTANGQTRTITTGQQVSVPLDTQSTKPVNDAQNKLPAVQPFSAQNLLNLLVQPGVSSVLLTPTMTFTPRPVGVEVLPPTVTNTIPPPVTNTSAPPPAHTPVPPTKTHTPGPSLTHTLSATPTSTHTATNTATNTATRTTTAIHTPTNTPTLTHTPTNAPTSTATATPTSTLSDTPTLSANVVTNLFDSGNGSLRGVISAAPAGATVSFSVSGTITLASPIIIGQNLTIVGPGATVITISGNNAVQIFNITAGIVSLSDLTLSNANNAGGQGGAIFASSTALTITNCAFNNNTAKYGAALNTGGSVTIRGSAFNLNSASQGGAFYESGGTATITNSTFYNNTSTGGTGGAIYNFGAVTLISSTIFGNSAGGGSGGGIDNSGSVTLKQSIVAGNTGSIADIAGVVTSQGYNLIGNTGGSSGWITTDIQNVSPYLEPYANYGGATNTLMLHTGSPAIDVIPPGSCAVTTDQRGVGRPQGNGCDIGAIERQASDPIPPGDSAPGGKPTQTPSQAPTHRPTLGSTRTPTSTSTISPTATGNQTIAPLPSVTQRASSTPAPTQAVPRTPTSGHIFD